MKAGYSTAHVMRMGDDDKSTGNELQSVFTESNEKKGAEAGLNRKGGMVRDAQPSCISVNSNESRGTHILRQHNKRRGWVSTSRVAPSWQLRTASET